MIRYPTLLLPMPAWLAALIGYRSPLVPQEGEFGRTAGRVPVPSRLNLLGRLERARLFVPSPYPLGDWKPEGLAFEDAWFTAIDGTRLHGWYVPHRKPRAVVLYCHGNGGNVALAGHVLRVLHDRIGVTAMSFDYRGYGRSEGTPTEAGVLADARAARAWLSRRACIPEKQIVLMGRSLGGAVAVDLAAANGARGLVLESTFTSIPEAGQATLPWLPVRRLIQARFNSLAKIRCYRGPLLQCHGTGDRLLPWIMGRQLFEAANEPKLFVDLAGHDHQDRPTDLYYDALSEFIGRLKPPRGDSIPSPERSGRISTARST